ncbi:MAG TPA: UvrB/UvrC motif-containing protein, partial [Patescibacteria group bacterium]|nr:UvrB/UvrC motif-containing protein [Patescibacteria group bacterium]
RSFSQQKRANLHYHLGLDPGLEEGRTTLKDYRANLRKLMAVIQGKKPKILKELEKDMKKASTTHNYETAAKIRNRINYLKSLDKQVIFSDKEFLDISKDHALSEIVNLLSLSKFPLRIEGFDISHMQGTDVVASMVVFTNGVSDKAKYRKFKTKLNKNDDFYNMNETIKRRFSEKNLNAWGKPDLVLIDGGKGQLDAAINALSEVKTLKVPIIGLAKRQEQIVINMDSSNVLLSENYLKNLNGYSQESKKYQILNLPKTSNLVKLLQRIRDESHRFAVSYHSSLKVKRQTKSKLEDIPGIGPITRKKILKQFGQINSFEIEEFNQLEKLIGKAKTNSIKEYISVK